jgi:hypothetical protein
VVNNATYFKFAVVRHPWSRLVSAFREKYAVYCQFNRTCFSTRYKVPIALNDESSSSLGNLTLTELLEVLVTMDVQHIDVHFRSSAYLCEIGELPYDFIGGLFIEWCYVALVIVVAFDVIVVVYARLFVFS